MNLLTRYNIWKLSACAKRHERKAQSLRKRLIAEIRQLNHEIREEEHKREVSSRLARKALHKLEQGKSLDWQSKGQGEAYKPEEGACLDRAYNGRLAILANKMPEPQQWALRGGIEL